MVADQKISGWNVAELRTPEATTKDPPLRYGQRCSFFSVPFISSFFSSLSGEIVGLAVSRRKMAGTDEIDRSIEKPEGKKRVAL